MNTPDTLPALDLGLILGFFLLTLAAGLYFGRRASRGLDDYFLGGRRLPWWVLGMSGTASNFDMTGTMVMVSFLFAIGLQGFWVAMRGGMCLPLGLLLVYMGAWLRRSKVMTTAEWMELRFGPGPAGQAARILSALANLVVTVAFLTYFVKGSGKFLAVFLPLDADACSLLMVSVGLLYTAASGLFGVVYTDVLQEVLMLAAAVWVGIQAATLPDHAAALAAAGPQWLSLAPQATAGPMNWLTDPTMYQAFGLCIVFWMARGLLEGAGGLTGGYMPQRYYAAKNDREAVYLTAQWIILLLFRWALIAGVVVLGLAAAAGDPQVASVLSADPEKTLPLVIFRAIPSGIRGVVVAGLMAAALSTFDSTLNAGASYWVRDIYQRYLHPEAGQRQLVRQGRLATAVLAALGAAAGLAAHNIDAVWSWITGPLSAGLFAPVLLRWYWWRFNGYGFAASTAAGLTVAVGLKLSGVQLPLYLSFPLAWSVSLLVGIVVSLVTSPAVREVLDRFYARIRPFGLWGPVSRRSPAGPAAPRAPRTLFWSAVAVGWQLCGVILVLSLVLHQWSRAAWSAGVFLGLGAALYFGRLRLAQKD